jgi:hypothetical protein
MGFVWMLCFAIEWSSCAKFMLQDEDMRCWFSVVDWIELRSV